MRVRPVDWPTCGILAQRLYRHIPCAGVVLLVLFGLPARADTGAAARYSAAHGERALLVWQKGRLRVERYGAGASRDKIENVYSITRACALWGLLQRSATTS
jgi:hypothetical protein